VERARTPGRRVDRYEFHFRADSSRVRRSHSGRAEGALLEVRLQHRAVQPSHTGFATTSTNRRSGSVFHDSSRSPAAENSAAMLGMSYLQLISVRMDSAAANRTRPIPGTFTTCGRTETRCIS